MKTATHTRRNPWGRLGTHQFDQRISKDLKAAAYKRYKIIGTDHYFKNLTEARIGVGQWLGWTPEQIAAVVDSFDTSAANGGYNSHGKRDHTPNKYKVDCRIASCGVKNADRIIIQQVGGVHHFGYRFIDSNVTVKFDSYEALESFVVAVKQGTVIKG